MATITSHIYRKLLHYNVFKPSYTIFCPQCIFPFVSKCHTNNVIDIKSLSSSTIHASEKKFEKPGFKITKVVTEDGVVEVKKKVYEARVTLLSPDDALQVISLDEAKKIAQRRNLKLIKISDRDPKSDRPVYKLITSAEFVSGERKNPDKKKTSSHDEKLLTINARITEHDLKSKIKQLLKWLEKENTAKIVISGNSTDLTLAERVFNQILEGVGTAGRIVQKNCKGGDIKFQVILPKKPKVKNSAPTSADTSDVTEPLPQ